jgi:hypothetical protein
VLRVQSKATDGINGRLHQNDRSEGPGGNGKIAEIFLGAGGQTAPGTRSSASQFSADWVVLFSKQQENSIGSVISVESGGLKERLDEGARKAALTDQIPLNPPELGRIWGR